ncbi:MAG: hypothetical protein KKA10_11570, partial [Euryarchaeota archaeon]|nr:hypothetical protein [Euryarchaeota archaeon]MCG2735067.1 hypothetical protein [Candidatus Methanoperedenaceae archaeon]
MSNKRRVLIKNILLIAAIFTLISSASAQVEIIDLFSDFTTSDVTINSTSDLQGKAVFELSYAGSPVESHEVPVDLKAGGSATKVILWEKKPQHDY